MGTKQWGSGSASSRRVVARFDDLNWNSHFEKEIEPSEDRRPRFLRRLLPCGMGCSSPLEGAEMARIKVAAFH